VRLIEQPTRWSCLATAWAMVLDCELDKLFTQIGHDGSEILYPSQPEPECRRAFHPSEFNWPAFIRGIAIVQVELNPFWERPDGGMEALRHPGGNERLLKSWRHYCDGAITGQTPKELWHAVAWDHTRQLILDPAYAYRNIDYMNVHTFWAAVPRRKEDE